MSDLLVIAFSDVQKMENSGRKLLPMQKTGQIDIEDVVVALKRARARPNWSNVKCEPLLRDQGAASAYLARPVGGALTDFSANDKFVKEFAEAIPLVEVTVFISKENASR